MARLFESWSAPIQGYFEGMVPRCAPLYAARRFTPPRPRGNETPIRSLVTLVDTAFATSLQRHRICVSHVDGTQMAVLQNSPQTASRPVRRNSFFSLPTTREFGLFTLALCRHFAPDDLSPTHLSITFWTPESGPQS